MPTTLSRHTILRYDGTASAKRRGFSITFINTSTDPASDHLCQSDTQERTCFINIHLWGLQGLTTANLHWICNAGQPMPATLYNLASLVPILIFFFDSFCNLKLPVKTFRTFATVCQNFHNQCLRVSKKKRRSLFRLCATKKLRSNALFLALWCSVQM